MGEMKFSFYPLARLAPLARASQSRGDAIMGTAVSINYYEIERYGHQV